ncbi:MAG TPA: TolC family protein [Verrucomicrobiae bacterium]|nr:TolC family protein [Verrucomicrobiae bacterium]
MNEMIKLVVRVGAIGAFVLCSLSNGRAQAGTNQVKSLTLQECIERALQNNLDIKIQRVNPTIQSWGVVSAQGVFDPALSGSTRYEDNAQPADPEQARSLGLSSFQQQTWLSQVGLAGLLPSGTQYGLSGSDTRTSGTLARNFVYTGPISGFLTQPILKNFGFSVNTALIQIARKSREIAVQNFVQQVINSISAVENAYYELVFAIEDHKAKLEDLNLAKQLLDETQRKVQIGVSSPLDVTTAESGVASREEAVILAERTIKDNENALKLLISQNVSEFRNTTFVPVNYPIVQRVETDVARSIRTALETRPDYLAARKAVERQNIQVKFNRNQLWPEIDLNGSYGWNGRGGTFVNWAEDVGSRDNPDWAAGVSVSFPIGDRQARANYHTARLQAEQLLLQLKQMEQQIIVAVDNAAGHVQTNLKSVDAASAARRLAEESYKAERTKLQAGTSTTLNVLTQESALADARSAEIRARTNYSESLAALAQAEGTILQQNNIVLNERF